MTIKEIAESVGKDETTVRRWISKLTGKMPAINDKVSASSPMYPADFDLDETLSIIHKGLGKNAAEMFRFNAEHQSKELSRDRVEVDYRLIGEMIAVAIKEALKENISVTTEQKALPGPQMSKRDQLRRLITQYSHENGQTQREAWGFLYESAYYILHVNIRSRAQNRGMQKIDYIEEAGLLDDCIAIMRDEVE